MAYHAAVEIDRGKSEGPPPRVRCPHPARTTLAQEAAQQSLCLICRMSHRLAPMSQNKSQPNVLPVPAANRRESGEHEWSLTVNCHCRW